MLETLPDLTCFFPLVSDLTFCFLLPLSGSSAVCVLTMTWHPSTTTVAMLTLGHARARCCNTDAHTQEHTQTLLHTHHTHTHAHTRKRTRTRTRTCTLTRTRSHTHTRTRSHIQVSPHMETHMRTVSPVDPNPFQLPPIHPKFTTAFSKALLSVSIVEVWRKFQVLWRICGIVESPSHNFLRRWRRTSCEVGGSPMGLVGKGLVKSSCC
jgi:hypothetical protein